MVAAGMSGEEILHEYPELVAEDIREALRYAAHATNGKGIPIRVV
jgi:uncharacterized protein (DUF433 family)